MNKNDKQRAPVPRLRFPEFRKMPGWREIALSGICDVNPTYDGLPESFYYIDLESVEAGTLRNPKRIERANAPSRAQRYLSDGDILYQTVRPYQRNNLLFDFGGEDDYVASTGYAQLRAGESVGFLYQLIHTDLFVERVLTKCTGSNYPAINSSDLESVSVWIPPDPVEQQKIADCLGSLDGLIAAEGRKLAALRDHKKGVMQQLFPREGKTRPRLRFPEFQDAPEWEERLIEEFFDVGSSKRVLQKDWTTEGVPFYRTRELVSLSKNEPFSSEVFISEELFSEITEKYGVPNEGDFLVSGVGTLGILYQVRAGDRFYFKDGNVLWLKLTGDLISDFFKYCFQSDFIQDQISGQASVSTVGTYTIQNAKKTRFLRPVETKEQRRIAGCLASLDALIAAQAEKLEALRTHKRGLMQQLFPSSDGFAL